MWPACIRRANKRSVQADACVRMNTQVFLERRGKPIPKGMNVIMLVDKQTGYPLSFIVQDKLAWRTKGINATSVVLDLVKSLPHRHYHVYFDNVREACDATGCACVRWRAMSDLLHPRFMLCDPVVHQSKACSGPPEARHLLMRDCARQPSRVPT